MKGTMIGACLLFLLLGSVLAHNGEYQPPKDRIRPPGAPHRPTGGRSPVPTPSPGRSSTPRFNGPQTTPSPGTVGREEAISWELVWELVRSAEPPPLRPPVPAPPGEHPILDGLRKNLTNESLEVRTWSLLALARSGRSGEVLEPLAADGALMRSPAMLAPGLSKLEGEDLERALGLARSTIEDPEAPLPARVAAVVAAGMCGPKGANLLLKTLSRSPGEPVRSTCLFALGLSGHPGARDLLLTAALPPKGNDDPVVRALLVHGLSRLSGTEVGGDVLKRLRDPAIGVRTAAALSLADRGREMPAVRRALVDLAQNGAMRPRSAALLALVLGRDAAAGELCRGIIGKPAVTDAGLAAVAALSLGLLHEAAAGPDLVRIAGDRSLPVDLRCAAAVGAGLARARGGGEALRKTAEKATDPIVAGYAFLGAMLIDPEKTTLPALKALKKEKRRRGRELLVQALGHSTSMEVIGVLLERLGDDYEVNREAARSLFRVDPGSAVTQMGVKLTVTKNPFERRYAAIVMGGALDGIRPTRFARHVLGVGLDARHPVTELFLYLESDILHGRWTKR